MARMKLLLAALIIACASAPALTRAEAAADTKTRIAAARLDYERGRKAIDRMDWKGAIAALESAAQHDPQDPEFQNLLGFSHRNAGNMDLAFKHYARALELNPFHRSTHEYIGRAYLMVDKPEKAVEHLKFLERNCPDGCRELELLKKAIDDYPWPPQARMTRTY
jgi:Flp pilus assembly protein TadD